MDPRSSDRRHGQPVPPRPSWRADARHRSGEQCLLLPGIGLGALVAEAREVTDEMFLVAADALADVVPAARLAEGSLYPQPSDLRVASRAIAVAVARAARDAGVGRQLRDDELEPAVDAMMWEPRYLPIQPSERVRRRATPRMLQRNIDPPTVTSLARGPDSHRAGEGMRISNRGRSVREERRSKATHPRQGEGAGARENAAIIIMDGQGKTLIEVLRRWSRRRVRSTRGRCGRRSHARRRLPPPSSNGARER